MIRLGLTCLLTAFAAAGCASAASTPRPVTPIFVLDSGTAGCANESVGVDLAIEHAVAQPGYLDCITVSLRADPDGTIWVCEPVRDSDDPLCDGPRMELIDADIARLPATWHTAADTRWSDPIQLLGRVRFL